MSPKVAAAPQKYKRAKFAPKLSKAAAERLNHVPHSVASVKGKERASTPAEDSPKRKAKAKATTKTEDTPEALPSTFKIIAGSYEKLLYGLEGSSTAAGSSYTFSFKPVFIFPAHISSVRAVAASPQGGKWLATGSGDEIVKVWDLRRRKEIGGLMHHEGMLHCAKSAVVPAINLEVVRLDYTPRVPLSIPSSVGLRGRHTVSFPC